jgi:DNA-directed RNA polymerase specialized sigma24 family protein
MTMAAAIDGQARAEQAALIARVGRGDLDAFHDLAELYARPMHRLAWRLLFDTDEAQQVVRDAFARLWSAARDWPAGDGRVGGWLYRTCTRLSLGRLRQRNDDGANVQYDVGVACLAALSGRSRAAIVLTRCEALPNATVAEILGMRLTAFESLLSDARTALLACLRQSMTRVDSLNQLLEEIRPLSLPSDFAARIAAEAASPLRHGKAAQRRQGTWVGNRPALAGIAAAGLLAASAIVAILPNGAIRQLLPGTARIERVAAPYVSIDIRPPRPASAPAADIHPAAPVPGVNQAPVLASTTIEKPAVTASRGTPARPAWRSQAGPQRLTIATISKGKPRKTRIRREPINLLPPGFPNQAAETAQAAGPTRSAAEAQPVPTYASYAQLAAERRVRMREYLRGLSSDELKQLRREERAVMRERRQAKERGIAQVGPGRP